MTEETVSGRAVGPIARDQPSQHPIKDEEDAIRVLLILRLLKREDENDEELRQQRIDTFEALLRAWEERNREGRD